MKQLPPASPDSSHGEKSGLSIVSILGFSLFLGLIAGAGSDKSHILPVAFISAIILYSRRNKIATKESPAQSNNNDSPKDYYAWPALNRFSAAISAVPYQKSIQQLAQENPINPEETARTKAHFFKAQLVPINDNPFDDNLIRIDINNKTVGYLNYDQARSFRRKLDSKQLANQITICTAMLFENDPIQDDQVRYGIRLDIELLE